MSDAPTSLVSLRERRTQVIAELSHAFARDEFDVDELDRRMEVAQRAITVAELDALTLDLSGRSTALAKPAVRSLTSGVTVGGVERPARQTVLAMMGGLERTGHWIVPTNLKVHCVMGGVELDFREANLAPGVTEVLVTCLMGGVDIVVPPNVAVDLGGSAILGGFEQSQRGDDALTAEPVATLRIVGIAMCGGVSVQTRRIGETAREAKKRLKQERKNALAGGVVTRGQAALPSAVVLPPDRKKR